MDGRTEPSAAAEAVHAEVVVYYDGSCALCNWLVARCLTRGVPSEVRFASQDSDRFRRLLDARPDLVGVDSVVIQSVRPAMGVAASAAGAAVPPPGFPADEMGRFSDQDASGALVRVRGEAVLWLLPRLRGPERWLGPLLGWLPRPVLDLGYRLVARTRRRIGRRLAECPLPPPEQRRHFIA